MEKGRKKPMNTYRITYPNGSTVEVKANSSLEVVKKYDLTTRENIKTRITQLEVMTIGETVD